MKKTKDVLEYAVSEQPHKVDRERGIIERVKVLGLKSRNGQSYDPAAIQKAAALYAGQHVFVAHPDRMRPEAERSPRDLFGWLENPRPEADGLYADLHFIKAHELAGSVTELAERRPDKIGLSHNAVVSESQRGSEIVFESIHRVRSVDLVCKPATTRGIFESEANEMDETMAPPAEVPAASLEDMILAKVGEILHGEGDPADKAKRISTVVKELLKIEEKLEEPAAEAPADSEPGESEASESAKEKKKLWEMAIDVLESAGIPADAWRVKLLARAGSDADRKLIAESWKPGKQSAKPRSGSVLESERETADKTTTPYDDPKSAAALLRRR